MWTGFWQNQILKPTRHFQMPRHQASATSRGTASSAKVSAAVFVRTWDLWSQQLRYQQLQRQQVRHHLEPVSRQQHRHGSSQRFLSTWSKGEVQSVCGEKLGHVGIFHCTSQSLRANYHRHHRNTRTDSTSSHKRQCCCFVSWTTLCPDKCNFLIVWLKDASCQNQPTSRARMNTHPSSLCCVWERPFG